MNSTQIMEILNEIDGNPSRLGKVDILTRHIADPMLLKVLKYAYDPFITFGIKPVRPATPLMGSMFTEDAALWLTLDLLAERTLTGNAAGSAVQMMFDALDEDAGELLWRVMSKDLRCGITEKTINLVSPGTVPSFEVMLAQPFEEKRITTFPVAVEPKLDGFRVICLVRGGKARFFSRNGLPFPAVEHLEGEVFAMVKNAMLTTANKIFHDELSELYFRYLGSNASDPTIMLDGEITSGEFGKTSGDMRRKSESADDAVYTIFDALPLNEFLDPALPILLKNRTRRHFLKFMFRGRTEPHLKLIERFEVGTLDEIHALYHQIHDAGGEGIIVKPFDFTYEKTRSFGWLKVKGEETEDLNIIGAYEGKAGTKLEGSLGGLVGERVHDGEIVFVGVGGGFAEPERALLWADWIADVARAGIDYKIADKKFWKVDAKKPKGKTIIDKLRAATGTVLIHRMMEVEFQEVTPDGSLRHPRFVRFRDDKAAVAA